MTDEEILSEQEMVKAAQDNAEAFGLLYDRYFSSIFGFIYRRTDSESLAGDLTSQTFYKALKGLKKYTFRGLPFSAWLYRIASNEVNKYYRGQKMNKVFSLEEERVRELVGEDHEQGPEEKIQLLIKFLSQLPTEMMEAIELRFFEGKGFKEIAFILDISESAAKMRTYRALEKLKEQFAIKLQA